MADEIFAGLAVSDLEEALDRSGEALKALRGGSLLITGGTGFFGHWLLAALAHANRSRGLGLALHAVTRSPATFAERAPDIADQPSLHLIAGDVRRFSYDGLKATHVLHAAADTSVAADRKPLELIDTIVGGTRHTLDAAVASGARDVLFVSSGAVYGGQGEIERIAEDSRLACDPLDRRAAYGEAKRMAEMLCAIYHEAHGLVPRSARCFAFVGPRLPLDAHFAIGNFIGDAIAGRDIVIKGDGTSIRSYLYAADLVAWLLRALTLGKPCAAYNVGSDAGASLGEIAETVRAAVPGCGAVRVLGTPQPGGFRSRYLPAVDRARTELGVEVWTSLPEAVRRTAAWARRSFPASS